MPEKTRRNSASVGLKMNLGGQVSAADSGLNAVMHHPQHRQEERDPHHPREHPPAHVARHLAEPLRPRLTVLRRHGGHTPASSNWKTLANIRSANVATMIVKMTVTTPPRPRPPTSKAKFTCWYR